MFRLSGYPHRLFLVLLLLAASAWAQKPVLQLDLHTLGFAEPDNGGARSQYDQIPSGVSFVDAQRVALGFLVRNERVGLSTRENPTGGYLLFHTLILDTSTGSPVAEKTWGNSSRPAAVFGLGDGRVLVRDGSHLGIYSPRFDLLHQFPLPRSEGILPTAVHVLPSASGHTVYVIAEDDGAETVVVLNGDSLRPLGSIQTTAGGLHTVTDRTFAFMLRNEHNRSDYGFYEQLLPAAGVTEKISDRPAFRLDSAGCMEPHLINDDTLAIGGMCGRLQLFSLQGKLVREAKIEHEYLASITPTADGKRFAVVSTEPDVRDPLQILYPFTHFQLHDGVRVRVYDTATLTPVFDVRLPNYILKAEAALSPDGSALAVLIDSRLSVYRVPAEIPANGTANSSTR